METKSETKSETNIEMKISKTNLSGGGGYGGGGGEVGGDGGVGVKFRNSEYFTHYLITRFSVNFSGMKTKNVFSEKRLRVRFNLFQKICFPSVINQTNTNFIWIIIIDKNLPNRYKDLLYSILSTNNRIRIEVVEWNKNFSLKDINWLNCKTRDIITTRLDDDDAIHPTMIDIIQQYYNQPNGRNGLVSFVSFPYGIRLEPTHKLVSVYNWPFLAIGLTMITNAKIFPFTIYAFNHRKIMRGNNIDIPHIIRTTGVKINNIGYILLQPKVAMWLYCVHENNDSGARFSRNIKNMQYIRKGINGQLNKNKERIFKKFNTLL